MKQPEPIVINNFQKGVAPSPSLGFADMRNLDVLTKPGIAQSNYRLLAMTPSAVSTTFTAVAATDIITVASTFQYHGHSGTSRAVTLTTTGTLPAGLTTGTIYYLIEVSSTTYKLASSLANADAGTQIDITDAGTGTHTITSLDPKLIKHFAIYDQGSSQIYFALDTDGRLWRCSGGQDWYLISGNTITNASGNGLVVWENYVIVFRNRYVDAYGPLTSALASQAWTTGATGWIDTGQAAGNSNTHYAIVGQDNIVYYANRDASGGVTLGSIAVATGPFDPATGSTYTHSTNALDLPRYKYITCLEELGRNLMIGTEAYEIYPWDRVSSSFKLPIKASERGIKAMATIDNILYFSAGTRGAISRTNGTSTAPLFTPPDYLTASVANSGATVMSMAGNISKLLFTLKASGVSGVYSIDISSGVFVCENSFSTDSYGTSLAPITPGAIIPVSSSNYFVGWNSNNSTYGIDGKIAVQRQPDYLGYLESQLFEVGNDINKRTFSILTINLAKPLVSGQGVRVSYRTNLTDSFTVLGTFDFTTYGGVSSQNFPAGVLNNVTVFQLKVELTNTDPESVGNTTTTTPELLSVILS